jgi:hypothetical protein
MRPLKVGTPIPTGDTRPDGCRRGSRRHWFRDDGAEGHDPVGADAEFTVAPVRVEPDGQGDGTDQLRADDAPSEAPYDAGEAGQAASDVFEQSLSGAPPLHRRYGK